VRRGDLKGEFKSRYLRYQLGWEIFSYNLLNTSSPAWILSLLNSSVSVSLLPSLGIFCGSACLSRLLSQGLLRGSFCSTLLVSQGLHGSSVYYALLLAAPALRQCKSSGVPAFLAAVGFPEADE